MLAQSTVEALLVGGVAGAGLVLTVFTLVVTSIQLTLGQRSRSWWASLTSVKEKVTQIEAKTPTMQLSSIEHELANLRSLHDLPWYISGGLFLTFGGYCAVAIGAALWLGNSYQGTIDPMLLWVFVGATVLLFLVGALTIKDIRDGLAGQYQSQKETAATGTQKGSDAQKQPVVQKRSTQKPG